MSDAATEPGERTDHEWVFRYGYRLVKRELRPGRWETVEVPLTREQYLHPDEEDQFMCKPRHTISARYVAGVMDQVMKGRPGAVVLMDVGVRFGPDIRPMRPDVSVFTGHPGELNINEGTFDVVEERATPLLVLEITSPSTRDVDVVDKVELYRRAGVPFYAIADYRSDEPVDLHLFGYRLTPRGYEQVTEDERGWLWLEPVGVWLAGEDGLLRCLDQAGNRIASHDESLQKNDEFKVKLEQIEGAMESEVSARHEAQRAARQADERAAALHEQLRAALAEVERLKEAGK